MKIVSNSERIYFIDFIKIISIFLIIVTHYLTDVGIIHQMFNVSFWYSLIDRTNINLGMLSCFLFVITSGCGLAISQNKLNDNNLSIKGVFKFYKKRYNRILIPFYLVYIIYFIIKVINIRSIHIFPQNIKKWSFIWTMFAVDEYLGACGIPTFTLGIGEWFLGCIILCYLFFPFLYYFHKKQTFVFFIIMSLYFLLTQFFVNRFIIPPHMNFLTQIYNFYIGIVLVDERIYKKINKYYFFISIILLLVIYFLPLNINVYNIYICTFCSVLVYIVFYSLENNIKNNGILINIIKVFNKYSYEIFLTHHFIIYQINYMLNYSLLNRKQFVLLFVFDLFLILLFSFVVNVLSNNIENKLFLKH